MPTIVTKIVGPGGDFTDQDQLYDYARTTDIVALDITIVAKSKINLGWPQDFALLSSSDNHRFLITAFDGMGPNDVGLTVFDYPTNAVTITINRGPYGAGIGSGIDIENMNIRVFSNGLDWGGSLIFGQHRAGVLVDNRWRFNRILDDGQRTERTFAEANYAISEITDSLIVISGAAGKDFATNCYGMKLARNTAVAIGAAAGNARFTAAQYDGMKVEDSVIIGFDSVASPYSTVVNCHANITPSNGVNAGLTVTTGAGALVVNEATDFRPKAAGPLIGAASVEAIGTRDILGNNRGANPDVGAWQLNPAVDLPTGSITTKNISGTTVTLSGTTTGTPTSGTATLTPTAVAYNSGEAKVTTVITFGAGTFSVTFSNVKVGQYTPVVNLVNSGGEDNAVNNVGSVDVTGASGSITAQSLDGSVLTVSGTTTGNPTSGEMYVPAASTANGASTVGPVALTFPSAGTFTATTTITSAGNYDAPKVLMVTAAGRSLPIGGVGSAFSVVGIGGNPEAPDPENPAPADITAPTVTSAAVANNAPSVVVLWCSETLNTGFVPAASAFTVGGHTVSSVAIVGNALNLTVAPAFVNGEAARTVAYVQPATNGVRDLVDNLLASFTGTAITNNVAVAPPPPDATKPTLTGAVTATSITQTGFVTGCPAATDNVGVTGYGYSINNGATYTPTASRSATIGGLTASTAYPVKWVAYDAAGNVSDPISLTITTLDSAAEPPPAPTVTGVLVTPAAATIQGGATQQFNAVALGTNTPPQGVTWEVDIGQVSGNGLVTAPATAMQPQTGNVTARSTFNTNVIGTAVFTVPAFVVPPPDPSDITNAPNLINLTTVLL